MIAAFQSGHGAIVVLFLFPACAVLGCFWRLLGRYRDHPDCRDSGAIPLLLTSCKGRYVRSTGRRRGCRTASCVASHIAGRAHTHRLLDLHCDAMTRKAFVVRGLMGQLRCIVRRDRPAEAHLAVLAGVLLRLIVAETISLLSLEFAHRANQVWQSSGGLQHVRSGHTPLSAVDGTAAGERELVTRRRLGLRSTGTAHAPCVGTTGTASTRAPPHRRRSSRRTARCREQADAADRASTTTSWW